MIKIVGVRFRSAGKVYYFDPKDLQLRMGDHVIAETSKGPEYGIISTCMKMVDEDLVQQPLRSLLRKASPEDEQKILLDLMDYSQVKPSLSQAQRIKKLSQEGKLWKDDIRRILNEDKKRYSDRIVLEHDKLMDYFPEYYTMDMIREEVYKMLEARAARLGKRK